MRNVFRSRAIRRFTIYQFIFAITFGWIAGPANSAQISSTDFGDGDSEVASLSIPMSPTNNRWAYDLINSDQVNASGVTGSGIRIALLDNGIDTRDSRIASKVIARFDATHSVSGQYDHGTGTSSIIAADPMPEAGIGGVAPGASILDVRVCLNTQCRNEWLVDGLKWAIDNDADVISMSLAGSGIDPAVTQLINDAVAQGISVVTAAGNQACAATFSNGNQISNRNCTQTTMPRSFPGSLSIPGMITVGAIGRDLTRNSYSNFGSFVDVVAPGTDVATLYPWGPNAYFGGTSAATPMVAGIVALIKQASPNLTPSQIQAILQASTTSPVISIPDLWESCSRVDNVWECSGLSPARWPTRFYTGAGVVDALSAVQMARSFSANSLEPGLTVTALNSALLVNWENAAIGTAPYSIYLDGKKVAESESSEFTIIELTNDTQYSIQVVSKEQVKTEPVLATPVTPISFDAPDAYQFWTSASTLHFYTRHKAPTAKGVISFENGDRAPCSQTSGSTFITCDYIMKTNSVTGQFRFVDELGNLGDVSSPITWSTSYLPAPLNVEVMVTSRTQIAASWDPISSATTYCYYDAGQGQWTPTSQTSAVINGVLPGLPQTFSVFASDESCRATGRHSPTYWFLAFSAPLAAPTELQTQEITSDRLRISFAAPVGASSYAVYRSDGKNWITGNADPVVEDVYSESDQGKSFTYWVTAIERETYGSQYGETSVGLRATVPQRISQVPPVTTVVTPPPTSVKLPASGSLANAVAAKKFYDSKTLAKRYSVKVISSRATVTISVSKLSKNVCTVYKSKLKTIKAGKCIVTFTVQEPKLKTGKTPKAIKTTKVIAIR